MRNVMINEAESIFEPFWDCGESSHKHQKFNPLVNYEIKTTETASVHAGWCGIEIVFSGEGEVTLSRKCSLDISRFDIFRFFGSFSKNVTLKVSCVIDGCRKNVMEYEKPRESVDCYDGYISGNEISEFDITFICRTKTSSGVTLKWLGLSNEARQKEMENRPSPYDSSWEGCFEENPEIKPFTDMYFNESELEALRIKVQKEPFASFMNKLRGEAEEYLKCEPEKDIGMYFPYSTGLRFSVPRDRNKGMITKYMVALAFVGIIDKRADMLRMACRMALSAAHYTTWTEGVMGAFPGATWHHRSFLEEDVSASCCRVLDWAGSFLTWHGRNIILDAIIMKGLPRLQSDFKTMEYLWHINQGVVFDCSAILIYIFLQNIYPRYDVDVDYCEKILYEMMGNYFESDGGVSEGAGYWHYTVRYISRALGLLSRYRKKPISELVPGFIRDGKYPDVMLSDCGEGDKLIPVNDCGEISYTPDIAYLYSKFSESEMWDYILYKSAGSSKTIDIGYDFMIFGDFGDKAEKHELCECFDHLPESGITSLRRRMKNGEFSRIFIQNSKIAISHTHADKGSFVIETAGVSPVIDRGVCKYGINAGYGLANSVYHNLLVPEINGIPCNQNITEIEKSGVITESSFENGIFRYSTDLTAVWDGCFEKYERKFYSDSPESFVVCDIAKCSNLTDLGFRLNTLGKISEDNGKFIIDCGKVKLEVEPLNWTPERFFAEEEGVDLKLNPVNLLVLYTGEVTEANLETRLTVIV